MCFSRPVHLAKLWEESRRSRRARLAGPIRRRPRAPSEPQKQIEWTGRCDGSPPLQYDKVTANEKDPEKKAPSPYKEPFFNNNFSYLDSPDYLSRDPFDVLKRINLTPHALLDVGGEVRLRVHNEDNLKLDGARNDYLLQRTRLYGDFRYDDWLRGYAELIDSTISFNRRPPRPSEEDRVDVLNLFVDVRLLKDGSGGALWMRGGRQELDFGSQRLCGAAEWANDRNTFDGVQLLWKSQTWDVEAFWTLPVPFARTEADVRNFRPPDWTERFMGVFATWHEVKDHTVDLTFLRLERDRKVRQRRPAPRPPRRQHLRRSLAGSAKPLALGSGRRLSVRPLRRGRAIRGFLRHRNRL